MKNTIEIQDNKVVKTFASHMDFVREQSVYDKLKGSGLAPEITAIFDGAIEHEYITGVDFDEAVKASAADPQQFIAYIKLFIEWYKAYRERLNLSLGDTDFSDFVIDGERLVCIDFEHCKPGKPETDIANLAAHICLHDGEYTRLGMDNSKIFVKTAWENLSLNSGRLYDEMRKALNSLCKAKHIEPMNAVNEYLACFVTSSFAHYPSADSEAESLAQLITILRKSNHLWMAFADDVDMEDDRFLRYLLGSNKDDYDALFLTDGGSVILCPVLLKVEQAVMSLELAKSRGQSFKDALTLNMHSKALAVENLK